MIHFPALKLFSPQEIRMMIAGVLKISISFGCPEIHHDL